MYDLLEYDSWSEKFKKPFGAVKVDENIQFTVKVKADSKIKNINLIIIKDNQNNINRKFPMVKKNNNFNLKLKLNEISLYFYYFEIIHENDEISLYGNNNYNGKACIYQNFEEINLYQLTVFQEEKVPDWFKNGILYHIFVDRFFNGNKSGKIDSPKTNSFIYGNWDDTPMYIKDKEGNVIRWDFYGGNLKGIIEKLDYLKDIGITILYLSPIFTSSSNHKYDTADYKQIDPMFGDERIFKKLIHECDIRGISIILDGVFSHTGDDSLYFNKYENYHSNGAYQSKDSVYYSWYNFKNHPDQYDCWWGVESLPNVNELNPDFLDYIIYNPDSVLKKWIKFKIKGWRLDVADELPSEFIEEFRKELKIIDNESVLFGEVWEDASNKVSYSTRRNYLIGNQLDSVTGYPFRNLVLSFLKGEKGSVELYNGFMSIMENYPHEKFKSNLNLLGTHDVRRLNTEINQDFDILRLAVVIQMTFEGVPYIYYGDEAGICGGLDPDNRKSYPWGKENNDIIAFYKELIILRKENEALIKGRTRFLITKPDIFSYIRYTQDESILIIINRSTLEYNFDMSLLNTDKVYDYKELKVNGKSFEILKLLNS